MRKQAFIVPTGILRLPWLRFFRAFPSVIRQMPGYNSQRRGTDRTLLKLIVFFCVLFGCKCILYYRHRVSTQLHLTNISILYLLCIRKLGARSGWVVSNPTGRLAFRKAQCPLYKGMGSPLGRSGLAQRISPLSEFDLPILQPSASFSTDYAIPLAIENKRKLTK